MLNFVNGFLVPAFQSITLNMIKIHENHPKIEAHLLQRILF